MTKFAAALFAAVLTGGLLPATADQADPALTVDVTTAAERLGKYLRMDTSTPPGIATDTTAPYIPFLIETYAKPLGLEYEIFWNRTLLLRWRTPEGNKEQPVVFLGHADVVPVAENELAQWAQPPFSGAVTDGYVWGRGAIDMKGTTITQFEAVAALQKAGIKPRRDIFFLINPDEEVSGRNGAGRFVDEQLAKLENPAFIVDEGSFVLPDILEDGKLLAALAVGEKGYLTLKLTVDAEAGHSSMPSGESAPEILSQALARLSEYKFPSRFLPPTELFLDKMAEASPFPLSFVLGNRWLFGGLIASNFEKKPSTNASIRTTYAVTMLRAGVKDNVIPRTAEAYVNLRILPGDGKNFVVAEFKRALGDERVAVTEHEFWGETPLAPVQGDAWERLRSVVEKAFPDAMVAPVITPATMDARFFAQAGIPSYRFAPLTLDAGERQKIHGVNERLSLQNIEQAIRAYAVMFEGL
jgi:carboxypeptidase PM20D1